MKCLKDFKLNVLQKKDGPLGHVVDWWIRKEFQNRGALHVHMVVWCDPETVPADAVRAELPRASTDNPSFKAMREAVKKFQVHNCRPERCFSGSKGSASPACKYGFPFKEQEEECLDESGIRLLYKRTFQEDMNIVPYNLPILLMWFGHMNIQRVTSGGWEVYLAKYVSKAEPSFDLKLPPTATEVERFLKTRIVGRLEVDTILLKNDLARASREVVFCPTEVDPAYKYIKRKAHMPADPGSSDIFYDTILDKYLDRPQLLAHLKYPDYLRQYRVGAKQKPSDQESESETSDRDEEDGRNHKEVLKGQNGLQDKKHRKITKRKDKKQAVPRWRFLLPNGKDQEKYYEQVLLLNVPLTRENVSDILSEDNFTRTYMEECMIRGLYNKENDAVNAIQTAASRGFDISVIREIAKKMVDSNWISSEKSESVLGQIIENRPPIEEETQEVLDMDNLGEASHTGDLLQAKGLQDLDAMKARLNPDQTSALNWMLRTISNGKQLKVSIIGAAGTGKSYLLKTFVEAAKQNGHVVQTMATTGVAAHLIGGC